MGRGLGRAARPVGVGADPGIAEDGPLLTRKGLRDPPAPEPVVQESVCA